MAVAYDTASAIQTFTGGTSLSWSHTAAGSNRLARVYIGAAHLTTRTYSVTWNSVSMTQAAIASNAGMASSVTGEAMIYEMVAPAASSQTVAITVTGGGARGCAISVSYTGVDQTTPSGTASTGTGGPNTTSTRTVTDSVTGDMVGDVLILDGGSTAQTATKTARIGTPDGNDDGYKTGVQDTAGAASVAMQWDWTGANQFAHAALTIKQSSSTPSKVPRSMLLGVG
jgi:hypothetical protein